MFGTNSALCRDIIVTSSCPTAMRKREGWRIDQFQVHKKIGSGYASTVYLATCKATGNQVAIKLYHKSKLSELNLFQVEREIRIHSSVSHNNIIQLWAAFEDFHGIYLVSEFASKGDVFADVEKRGGQMTEADTVRQVLHPFLLALMYLHDLKIMHRDIKPENLLFSATGVLKVADFGLSINFEAERPVTRVGTLDYMAPEVVVCPDKRKPSDHKDVKHLHYTPVVDAWAVGVLAYELIVGRPPFDKGHKKLTIAEIVNGEPSIPSFMSEGASSFIRWALTKDKHKRPTVHQLVEHSWIISHMHAKKPHQRLSERFGLGIVRADSFNEPRSVSLMAAAGLAAGGTAGAELEDVPLHAQVQALQHSRLLGHSNSMSATDMMRWRDIAFNADPNTTYDYPGGLGSGMPKRRSDMGTDSQPGSKRASFASNVAALSRHNSSALLQALSRHGSGMLAPQNTAEPGSPSSGDWRPMSREELFASLQASAQQLNQSGSFASPRSLSPSSSFTHSPRSPAAGSGSLRGTSSTSAASALQRCVTAGIGGGPARPGSAHSPHSPSRYSPLYQQNIGSAGPQPAGSMGQAAGASNLGYQCTGGARPGSATDPTDAVLQNLSMLRTHSDMQGGGGKSPTSGRPPLSPTVASSGFSQPSAAPSSPSRFGNPFATPPPTPNSPFSRTSAGPGGGALLQHQLASAMNPEALGYVSGLCVPQHNGGGSKDAAMAEADEMAASQSTAARTLFAGLKSMFQ